MKKYIFTGLLVVAFAASCSEDDAPGKPSISLSQTNVTASAGDEVSVTVTTKTEAGFQALVVTKLWDGAPVVGGIETFTEELDEAYVYTVEEEDADHVVTLNFTVIDDKNKTASKDLVIEIELTASQLLLKYNWRLSSSVRKKTDVNDPNDYIYDNVYHFNTDGTFDMSIGEMDDGLFDFFISYCLYDLNESNLRLLINTTSAFGAENDKTDSLYITTINDLKFEADVNYFGLDVFNEEGMEDPYEPIEAYHNTYVAVPRTGTFDPYKPGATDDAGPVECREGVVLDND